VWHALAAVAGEMGYPKALSARSWGVEAVLLGGEPLRLGRPLGSYVIENILFKVAFPVEFHAQSAVEGALRLHPKVLPRLDRIRRIVIATQAAALRIIDKRGPLTNPADRDHCLQYAVAVALLQGRLDSDSYGDEAAADPRIDTLREKMTVVEEPRYSRDYLDPSKRAIGNRIAIEFEDGGSEACEIEYPLGHPRRRDEARPLLRDKFRRNLAGRVPADRIDALLATLEDPGRLAQLPVDDFISAWCPPAAEV